MKEKKILKLGDDTLGMIRELLQLAILTGTNIVDHFRLLELEVDEETGKIIPTEDYIKKYNLTIQTLEAQAEELQAQMSAMDSESNKEQN